MVKGIGDSDLWNALRRRVTELTRGNQDSEDFLHSAFIKLENYRLENTVRRTPSLLIRAAINLSIDNYRRVQRRDTTSLDLALDVRDRSPLQDEALVARERLARVSAGLDRLPVRTKDIFLMYRLDGLRYDEIALRYKISESAVEKHVARAMLFLKQWTLGY